MGCLEKGGCGRLCKWGEGHGDECPRALGVMIVVGVVGILPHTHKKRLHKGKRGWATGHRVRVHSHRIC